MALSLRLDRELVKEINQAAKLTGMGKSELVRRCIKQFLPEILRGRSFSPYGIYRKLEAKIPGSGHGSLSINHRTEVLKRIRKGPSRDSH